MSAARMVQGRPYPMGATIAGTGVNFAVFSAHAKAIQVCLFDPSGRETARLPLPEREGDIWFGRVPDLGPGALYGLRAGGPYAPKAGHRFNPNKLLVDPYAKALHGPLIWDPALMGHGGGGPDPRDSAPFVPRAIVLDPARDWPDTRPATAWTDTVIYEAHMKGLTMQMPAVPSPGTFRALGSAPVLDHLTKLGVTAIELLPAQAFITDAYLQGQGLPNYWGYQTLGFFAPHQAYLSGGRIEEVQEAVAALHQAGIEVILDVVYNHTCEGDGSGPTLSFRGLDNASYYRLHGAGIFDNVTGTGNTLNLSHPAVMRMVMDSLRHWVEVFHVDGFRFDLASTLGRADHGFERDAPFFQALRQDPVLSQAKLIAEPWDIGPGGYQLGQFPPPFAEWNDRFRDTTRRVWRGDKGHLQDLAARVTGSADLFDHGARRATSSVNFVTAHDGFTLTDLVSYVHRHNEANGEDGRDGHGENLSDNLGQEGPTDDPTRLAARALRRRNLMATLMLSQGVPMLLAGDEIGNSQGGNNNAYAMDNPTAWIDWSAPDHAFSAFVTALIAARKAHPALRQPKFLHGEALSDGARNLTWFRADGSQKQSADWEAEDLGILIVEMRTETDVCLVILCPDEGAVEVTLPPGDWRLEIDTARPGVEAAASNQLPVRGPCVALLSQASDGQ